MTWELLDRIAMMALIALAFVALLFLPRFVGRAEKVARSRMPTFGPDAGPYRTPSPCESIAVSVDSVDSLPDRAALDAAYRRAADGLAAGKISSAEYEREVMRLTDCAQCMRTFRAARKGVSS